MREGICCAGNMIVDITYPISDWPAQGELTHITDGIGRSTGGSVCNTVTDLARLDGELPLYASGIAGHDSEGDFILSELGRYPNIDLSSVTRSGHTGFTVVMSNERTKERTFFYHSGGTDSYCAEQIDLDGINARIFHVGYALLLPGLDSRDPEYGTGMARLLHDAREKGMKTSIDVVTEMGERFKKIVTPSLKYTDYCIINELEAQQISGVALRDGSGALIKANLPLALKKLKELGVKEWAVIHCPELGCGMDESGNYLVCTSLRLPMDYIKGTVGAGDAFCAGVLYAACKGTGLNEALHLGTCAAAASLSQPGASDGVGTVEEVMRLEKLYPSGGTE